MLPQNQQPTVTELAPDATALAALQAELPELALPAWDQLLNNPGSVGLVAYTVGNEANGIYHNADMQMPLASVVKIVHLVAYAEATAAGELDPTSYVMLETLEQYYLPGYDLGSHNNAVTELVENGLVLPNPDRIRLEDVPWMMMRYSANAATDYLHMRLGQTVIEETAVSLNLTQQTAPCTFLGQFMGMSNQTRLGSSDRQAIETYLENPESYGLEVAQLAESYVQDSDFREAEQEWHQDERRPSTQDQRFFSHTLNAHGTPREYAALMAQIAQNGLTNPESSFLTRRYLEWPMIFPANQERFSNLGYKNGSLPGILNTAYYAYPIGEVTPTIVILFYRDLPGSTYRSWRNNLAHDEFARWLLDNPEGLALLKLSATLCPINLSPKTRCFLVKWHIVINGSIANTGRQTAMNFALTPYLFLLFLSVSVCWFIAFYSWRRRHLTAASALAVVMFSAGFWALFYGLQLISETLTAKLLFFNVKQLGAALIGPALLLFALRFTQQRIGHPRLLRALLLVQPVVSQLLFWTNPWHGFAGTPTLQTAVFPFPVLQYNLGPWFWLSIFIGYILFIQAAFILIVRLPSANKLYRKQLGLLLTGFVIPWVAGTLGIFGIFNWQLFDISAFIFWLSGVFIGYGMFRFQLLSLSPVAYSAVFSSIRDGIIVLDENGRIVEINPATLRLLGLREREIIGQQLSDILPVSASQFFQDNKPNEPLNFGFFYEWGGQNRYLEAHGARLVSNIYATSGYVLILYDVTERKLAERAWEVSESRYRTIFETDSAATIMIEADTTISLANERFANLSGYARQEIEGKIKWPQFVHKEDLPQMIDYHRARRNEDETLPNEYEFRFINRDGEEKDVYISVALVPGSSVSIASLLDITDRKLAEQLLQQRATDLEAAVLAEQERSAIILESISDAIALSDLEYRTVYINPAFSRLTGYNPDEIVGKPATFMLNGRLPAIIWQQLQNAIIDQKVWEGEIQLKRKNGGTYDAATLIAPVYDGKKKLIGFVSSHRDITKTKQLEESRRRFVTNISHELRTPVTNLKLYTDLLHRHFDSSRRDHYFEVLNEQMERLERIIQNTLEITGLEDNQKEVPRELIRWERLCDTLQLRLHPQAREKNILLKFEPSVLQSPGVMGDSQRLGQALYELVHNAIVFTQPGGKISVTGELQEAENISWLLLSVCDNGPGIDPQEQGQVFDRFFRGKRAAAGHIPGTGLGLSMVKLIVEAHNGRITLKSTPGQGSTFTLWLPLH